MVAISRWFDGSSRSIKSGLSSKELGEHQPRLLSAGECRRRAVEIGFGEAQSGEYLFDAMVDGVGVLVLDLAVDLVIAALGSLAVEVVFGLGHLLGGFFELALEVDQRGEARLGDFDQVCSGSKSISWRKKLSRIPGRTKSLP